MYQRKRRLSPRKQGDLIKLFVAGATARATAEIVGVDRNTAATFFMRRHDRDFILQRRDLIPKVRRALSKLQLR